MSNGIDKLKKRLQEAGGTNEIVVSAELWEIMPHELRSRYKYEKMKDGRYKVNPQKR